MSLSMRNGRTGWQWLAISSILGMGLLMNGFVAEAGAQGGNPPVGVDPASPAASKEKPLLVTTMVTTDKKSYASGDPIKMTFTVTNKTKEAVRLSFSNGQRYDFVLREETKPVAKILWQWSRGKMFNMMLSSVSLEPGKSLTYTATYGEANGVGVPPPAGDRSSTKLAAGAYTVTASLTTMGAASRPSATTTFVVK